MAQMTLLWLEGARLRTLPAAVAPVIIGAACAAQLQALSWGRTALALGVALLLQIGVNFANDYSDGVRGTDEHRVGPPRLTGSGAVAPRIVLSAALTCFALAALAGLALVALAGTWWMIGVGALAIVAAWFYTGGRSPYGYMGIGASEVLVFVFFGLVATVGTTYTQALDAPWWVWVLATGAGCISVALLMVNNIRDRETDEVVGKRTLVVRIGDRASRWIYVAMVIAPAIVFHLVISSTDVPFEMGGYALPAFAIVVLSGLALSARMLKANHRQEYLALLRDTGFLALVNAAAIVWIAFK